MKRSVVIFLTSVLLLTSCASRTAATGTLEYAIKEGSSSTAHKDTDGAKSHPLEGSPDTTKLESAPEQESEPEYVAPIPDGEWKLLLVNDRHTIPETFEPELEEVQGIYRMDARVAPMMRQMIADAKSQGVDLMVCSAYRPYSSQQRNFEASVTRYMQAGYSREQAEAETLRLIAAPGSSEHQTGLAADIVTPMYQALDDGYAETKAARWLKANASSYGFILRYPEDKVALTHIEFEPWHYRYVGEEAAREIMAQGMCLEEYLGE